MNFNFFKKIPKNNRQEGVLNSVENSLDQYDWIYAGKILLQHLSRESGGSQMIEWWSRAEKLNQQKDNGIRLAVQAIQSKIADIYNVKVNSEEYKKIIQKHREEKRNLGNFIDEKGEKVELKMTIGQLMKRWMELQNEAFLPTFKKTMGYTDEMVREINNSLTDQEQQLSQWLLSDFFPTYIKSGYNDTSLSEVYADMYRMYLPDNEGDFYIETDDNKKEWVEGGVFEEGKEEKNDDEVVEIDEEEEDFDEEEEEEEEDNDLEHDVLIKMMISKDKLLSSSGRKVTGIIKSPIKGMCIYESLFKFILQLEHFKSFARFYRDAYSVLYSEDVREVIQQHHGGKEILLLDDLLDSAKRGYIGESKVFDLNLFLEDFDTFKRKRVFPPKEVNEVIAILKETEKEFNNSSFQLVKKKLKGAIRLSPDSVVDNVKALGSPQEFIYSWVANIAGDFVESGQYHLHRGLLNPAGPGEDLLRLFDNTIDKLVEIKAITQERANKEKSALRENIKYVG